jgi:cell filamentation protein
LKNRLGIADPAVLADVERNVTAAALFRIRRQPIPGRYDLNHLRAFHLAIFRDVYPWAGRFRTVAMSRTALFALPQHIEPYLSGVLASLDTEGYLRDRPFRPFVERLAHYLAEVNAVHPFREGNGRTQRAFFRQLARDAGWQIPWERMDPDENVAASIAAMRGDERPLAAMLAGLVQPEAVWPPFGSGD